MQNLYELVLVFNPILSEKELEEATKNVTKYLAEKKAKIKSTEKWGLKKLAYPIKKVNSGYYYLYEVEAESTTISPFELFLKRNVNILRFLTIKMDKEHKLYAEKRKTRLKQEQPQIFISQK